MLEIKKFPVEMPFPGGGWWFLHTPFYIHTPGRLDKSRSALAEARLKSRNFTFVIQRNFWRVKSVQLRFAVKCDVNKLFGMTRTLNGPGPGLDVYSGTVILL